MQAVKRPKYVVKAGETIDKKRLVWHTPHEDRYKKVDGGENIVPRSTYHYLRPEDDVECELIIMGPKQSCFGPSPSYDKKPDAIPVGSDAAKDFLSGVQITYPMTSLLTLNKPTDEEKAFKKNMDIIYESAFEHGVAESKKPDTKIPPTVARDFKNAGAKFPPKKGEPHPAHEMMRPLYEYPKNKEKNALDKTKPQRMYVELMTRLKGRKMIVETPFNLPGQVKRNPMGYVGKSGNLEPVFVLEGINFVPGKKFAAGVKVKLYEANFTPVNRSRHDESFLSPNTDEPVAEGGVSYGIDDGVEGGGAGYAGAVVEEGEDEGFTSSSNPLDDLAAAGTDSPTVNHTTASLPAAAKPAAKAVAKAVTAAKTVVKKPIVEAPADDEVAEAETSAVTDGETAEAGDGDSEVVDAIDVEEETRRKAEEKRKAIEAKKKAIAAKKKVATK